MIVTMYGLYFNHYKSLRRMMAILKTIRHSTGLPWVALFLSAIGLGLLPLLLKYQKIIKL